METLETGVGIFLIMVYARAKGGLGSVGMWLMEWKVLPMLFEYLVPIVRPVLEGRGSFMRHNLLG